MPEILMITTMAGAENCAAMLSKQFQMNVETASSRKDGIAALRRREYLREYLLVIIDESMIEPEEDGSDALLKHTGLALPLEINFAISGYGRLARAVRAALSRRARERELAARAAASSVQNELREMVAGLLLHSQLALAEPSMPPGLAARLRGIVELAAGLGKCLDDFGARATPAELLTAPKSPAANRAPDESRLRPVSDEESGKSLIAAMDTKKPVLGDLASGLQ
jgi:hypothetical protein